MNVWGGCCGTGDTHLREIVRNVRLARSTFKREQDSLVLTIGRQTRPVVGVMFNPGLSYSNLFL